VYLAENCIAYIVYRLPHPLVNDRNRTRKFHSFFYVVEHASDDVTRVYAVLRLGPVLQNHRGNALPSDIPSNKLPALRDNSGEAVYSTSGLEGGY
jgi:hypothetical protein